MIDNKTYNELIKENKELKKLLQESKKREEVPTEKCSACNGSGEVWTYWDGDTYCHQCMGSGRVRQ
jgi:DnaJ-class molecular chaperone